MPTRYGDIIHYSRFLEKRSIKCVVILPLSQRWVEPRGRGEGKWAKDCGSRRELAGSDPVVFKGYPLPNRANLQGEIMQSPCLPAPLSPPLIQI